MSGENRIAELQGRLAEFVRLVRLNDFHVGVAEEIDARRVALNCGLTDGQRLHWGLRALLCSDQDEWERFDELFDAYWRSANMRSTLRQCLRFGGMSLQLAYRRRCRRQPRLILIVDVSRSMSLYSTVFLRFARRAGTPGRGTGAYQRAMPQTHLAEPAVGAQWL
jgi:uncharacterized protein with von Willebrand factor type A (vWA) domain